MIISKIGEYFGKALNKPCITIFWIPDGYKDTPADRKVHREFLKESLDEIFSFEIDGQYNVESKLFGNGSESYVVGAIWDYYCLKEDVPTGMRWMSEIRKYENADLSKVL